VDPEWRDLDSEMAVWLRLIDKQGVVASGDSLSLHGETPGWTGRAENAPLLSKTMTFTAPGAAEGIWVFFISNGGRDVLGQMIAGDVSLNILRPADAKGQDISLDCATGSKTPNPLDLPAKWTREGERPDIAQILPHAGLDSGPALFLNDNDPDKFGVWRSRPVSTPLKAGDRVILKWKTAYSIGKGGQGMASYSGLKPGNYWFRGITVHHNGLPAGNELSLPIVILPPIYQRPAFWLLALAALSGLAVLVTRRITKKRMMARLQALERQRMLESERTRIARDIHDDLGATLPRQAGVAPI
jgi:hypothetical protein